MILLENTPSASPKQTSVLRLVGNLMGLPSESRVIICGTAKEILDRLDRQSNKVRDVKKNYGKMSNEEKTSKERNKYYKL